jgi:hypothetical protein
MPSLVKIGPMVLGKKIFLIDLTQFFHFCDYFPFEEGLDPYLNKLEFPLPKDNLYQVWFNLACWFWRRGFKKNVQCIFTLSLLSPLGAGYPLSLNKCKPSSPKDDLCQVWLKLAWWFWRKRFLNDLTPFLHFSDELEYVVWKTNHGSMKHASKNIKITKPSNLV